MPIDSKKAAIGLGIAAVAITGVILLTRKAAAAPPPPPPPEPGKGNLYGIVTNDSTSQPIPGVLVSLDGLTTLTDENGRYELLELTPGDYTATFSKAEYQTVTY